MKGEGDAWKLIEVDDRIGGGSDKHSLVWMI